MKDLIYELGQVALKTIWLALGVAAVIGALKAMSWADTGMRTIGIEEVEP